MDNIITLDGIPYTEKEIEEFMELEEEKYFQEKEKEYSIENVLQYGELYILMNIKDTLLKKFVDTLDLYQLKLFADFTEVERKVREKQEILKGGKN